MGVLDGKVAFITGAARGQGRSHAWKLAEAGADIIAVDICSAPTALDYEAATTEELDETARGVEKFGRRAVTRVVDVRELAALDSAVAEGVGELGGVDIVVANAAVVTWDKFWEMPEDKWQDVIDINLTGVWKTLKAATPVMIEQGRGGSIIVISSVAGIKALPFHAHYAAAKHGVVGLMKTAAVELGMYNIRVNSIHPWAVDTPMMRCEVPLQLFAETPAYGVSMGQILPQGPSDPDDISNAVLWLASDASRCVTGTQLPVDLGATTV